MLIAYERDWAFPRAVRNGEEIKTSDNQASVFYLKCDSVEKLEKG